MTIYEFFPVLPKQVRLSCWSDILVWRGCGERSDSSAQVLRNSRPEFRLSPPETISPARLSQIWPLKISPPVIAEDFGGGGLSLRRPVPTHGPVNGRCRRTTVRWRDERSEGLRCDSPPAGAKAFRLQPRRATDASPRSRRARNRLCRDRRGKSRGTHP